MLGHLLNDSGFNLTYRAGGAFTKGANCTSPLTLVRGNEITWKVNQLVHNRCIPDVCNKWPLTALSLPVSLVCRYTDHCQEYAWLLISVRDMQVSWPVSGVYKNPDQCQGYAGILASVRGIQVSWPVSGECKYPGQCQGNASILASVRGMQVS